MVTVEAVGVGWMWLGWWCAGECVVKGAALVELVVWVAEGGGVRLLWLSVVEVVGGAGGWWLVSGDFGGRLLPGELVLGGN